MNDLPTEAIEAAVERLRELAKSSDPETAHQQADLVLCDVLELLDCHAVVEAWRGVKRWYA